MNALLAALVLATAPAPAAAPKKAPVAERTDKAAAPAAEVKKEEHKDHKGDCHHPENAATPKAPPTGGWVLTKGEKLSGSPSVELAALLKSPEAQDGKTVTIEGTVRKACERKGCWMELAPDAKSPGVRVTFKDYGFFVPLDSAGSTARVEGLVKIAALTEDNAKHYESEGAIVPRGKDGKPREVQLVATGVELRK